MVFRQPGPNAYARLYHSVALLLPDATVWLAGSNPQRGTYESHMEIYQPAYLFTRDANNNVILATPADHRQCAEQHRVGRGVYGFHSGRCQYFASCAGAAGFIDACL